MVRTLVPLLLALLGAPSPVAAAPVVRLEPSVVKVLKNGTPAVAATAIQLEAVRNEWVAFQVVIASAEALDGVTVTLSDLDGPEGAKLPAAEAELTLEHYVDLDFASPCDFAHAHGCDGAIPEYLRLPGAYPDALVPFVDPYSDAHEPVAAPFAVPAGDLQTVFVDWHVPVDTPPGDYAGKVTVTAGGATLADLDVAVHVWEVTLPDERTVATAFGFGDGSINDYHGGPGGPDEATRERIVKNYHHLLHRHRIDPTDHGHGLGYGSFTFADDGTVAAVDFSGFDAIMGPRLDGSWYPDGAGLQRFNLGFFEPGHGKGGLTDDQWAHAAATMALHLQEKGWLDHTYLYSADEPWMPSHAGAIEAIAADTALLDRYTDLWKGHALVTGPWVEELDGCVGIWCPVTPMYGDTYWPAGMRASPAKYVELRQRGVELWFYVCNANFPPQMGYDVDSPLGWEPRLLKWGAWAEDATGFLYWRVSYWQDPDPWHVLVNLPGFGDLFSRNGDGILIYPGDHDGSLPGAGSPPDVAIDGPVASYRLKQVRDGLEDWELFRLAAAAGGEAYVRAQVATVYRAFGQPLDAHFDPADPPWTLDYTRMLEVRRNVVAKLQYLEHPDRYADPEAPVVVEPTEPAPEANDVAAEPAPEIGGDTASDNAADTTADAASDTAAVADSDEAGGGGGCATGRATSGPLSLLGALLALVAVRRLARRTLPE